MLIALQEIVKKYDFETKNILKKLINILRLNLYKRIYK